MILPCLKKIKKTIKTIPEILLDLMVFIGVLVVMGSIVVSTDIYWVLLVRTLNPNGIFPNHTTKRIL